MIELVIGTVLVLGAVGAVIVAFGAGRRSGQDGERVKTAETGIEHARRANEIDENVHRLGPAERERLLNRRD